MEDPGFNELALELTDLEIAVFLCLAAHEHCLVETTGDGLQDVVNELALVGHFL